MENNMKFYVLRIGKKYYSWNSNRETMTLQDSIESAFQYMSLEEVNHDLNMMLEDGVYKGKKKTILEGLCVFKEI